MPLINGRDRAVRKLVGGEKGQGWKSGIDYELQIDWIRLLVAVELK